MNSEKIGPMIMTAIDAMKAIDQSPPPGHVQKLSDNEGRDRAGGGHAGEGQRARSAGMLWRYFCANQPQRRIRQFRMRRQGRRR